MDRTALASPVGLLEREHEVEDVQAALREAGKRAGRLVVIEGAPGLGKSRLLELAIARASELGFRVLGARGTELEQGFPFGVVRQLFEWALLNADEGERERWLAGAATLGAEVLTGAPTTIAGTALGTAADDPTYAWQHGLYWLAANVSSDSPLALVVDDMQWCDGLSAKTLAFIARRLEGQALAMILATRPLDPAASPDTATLAADPDTLLLRLSPLTEDSVRSMIASRLAHEPDRRFTEACIRVTGGNPLLVGELLSEAATRGLGPTAENAADVDSIVPRGVSNAVLLRLARLDPEAGSLARALSTLGDGAQVRDAARLAELTPAKVEARMASLVSAGVIESGASVRFVHPILRAAIYEDLSPAERERLHCAASKILEDRGAPVEQVAAHVMHTEPGADAVAVALLREAASEALALGDATRAAAMLKRAVAEPPPVDQRAAVVLELGLARARAALPDAIAPLAEVVDRGLYETDIVAAAIELSGILFFAGRAAEAAAILNRAKARLPPAAPGRERLEVALLGASYTSVSARREADATIAALRDPGGPARGVLEATTLATLAMDELMYLRSAAKAADLASRSLAAGLPSEPHRGEAWAIVGLAVLAATDQFDAALGGTDEILARARERGAAATVANISALRAFVCARRGDMIAAQGDAEAAIELGRDLLGVEFVVLAVSTAVLVGLDRDETPESLRRLIENEGIGYDDQFSPSSQLRYASGVLRAADRNHEGALEELLGCGMEHPALGGENPAVLPWRSAAAVSLAELDRHAEARELAADEVRRAEAFGAPRALGVALRAQALVGPAHARAEVLRQAQSVLEASGARLEHARVLADLGATLRAAGERSAAREPLLEALSLSTRCGATALERRVRAELASIGIRPRTIARSGADSLTPSELRVARLAADGGTNREIAQTLFVTEKTVETHLGRAFRKLDISSRRQLQDALRRAAD
ncbi:MAG TPA: AAA family ATPase [Solirubrobacteraceae bacterium]|nr:AAA family ATPase [Solirubrobacteraceae bacterium]